MYVDCDADFFPLSPSLSTSCPSSLPVDARHDTVRITCAVLHSSLFDDQTRMIDDEAEFH